MGKNLSKIIMLGAIIGDVIGSRFEFNNLRSKDFNLIDERCFFTDDTVCTVAVADWILQSSEYGLTSSARFSLVLQDWCTRYPGLSYGGNFQKWIKDKARKPYGSFGNGAAMRISPVGLYFSTEKDVLKYSDMVTSVTHNHPEGMKGARAVALSIFLAKAGKSKAEIRKRIVSDFGYNLNFTCDSIRASNQFNETCQVTVPQALVCFLESVDFEDSIRLAVSIGGDSDTIAAITGSIAEAFYKEIPEYLVDFTLSTLSPDLVDVIVDFYNLLNPTTTAGRLDIPKLMKDELTTEMHEEFTVDEETDVYHRCISIWCLMKANEHDANFADLCKQQGVTVDQAMKYKEKCLSL